MSCFTSSRVNFPFEILGLVDNVANTIAKIHTSNKIMVGMINPGLSSNFGIKLDNEMEIIQFAVKKGYLANHANFKLRGGYEAKDAV